MQRVRHWPDLGPLLRKKQMCNLLFMWVPQQQGQGAVPESVADPEQGKSREVIPRGGSPFLKAKWEELH